MPPPHSIDWSDACVTSSVGDPEKARLNQLISDLSEHLARMEDIVHPRTTRAGLPISADERITILENAVEAANCMNVLAITIKNARSSAGARALH